MRLRLHVIDRVPRGGLDRQLGQGEVGRRLLFFPVRRWTGADVSAAPFGHDSVFWWHFGPWSVLGSVDVVMPHSLIVPGTAQSR